MKFEYDYDTLVSALSYTDLKGLILMLSPHAFDKGEYPVTDLEAILKFLLDKCEDSWTKHQIESLMISCARVNSIGY